MTTTPDYVDHIEVSDAELDQLTADNTIGLFRSGDGLLRGEVFVDTNRLRQALILAEEEFAEDVVEFAIVDHPDGGGAPLLLVIPYGGSSKAVALAPRYDGQDGYEPGGDGA